ncbi:MAG: DEAD/DEAH box helicase [Desulfatirhabdiaceae bacterium]
MISESKTLVAAVLPPNNLILEQELTQETLSADRRQIETRLFEMYSSDPGKAILALGLVSPSFRLSPSVEYWRSLSAAYIHELLVDPGTETLRENQRIDLPDETATEWAGRIPEMVGADRVDAAVVIRIWNRIQDASLQEIKRSRDPVEDIIQSLSPGQSLLDHRVHFHLVENRQEPETPFAFLATYSTRTPINGGLIHLPLGQALKEYGDDTPRMLSLLSSVHKAASSSPLIQAILDSGEIFHPLRLTTGEAYQILRETALYESAGILCRIPRWWNATPRKISVGLSIGDRPGKKLDIQALLSCRPVLHIDGETISPEEAREILARYDGLAMIKGKWTVVDKDALEARLSLFEQAQKASAAMKIPFSEAIQMLMGMQSPKLDAKTKWSGDVLCGDWLKDVMNKLRTPASLKKVRKPAGLKARLRPYQQTGLNWLTFLHDLGFGACLADDMGLGKTVQVLALLQSRKEAASADYAPSLLIVPASLIDNWLTEIRRFTPGLRPVTIHPQYGDIEELATRPPDRFDLALTTYAMARKLTWLKDRTWYYVILDEAQAIKNPGTSQTRAVKEIPATHRIVMTGTPVENRLGDLWSLFDFANRGLLGSAQGFRKFADGLHNSPDGYTRIRQVIQPYILRRLKTDSSIISDITEKIAMKTWASLSKKQALLYRQLVKNLAQSLEESEGIQRKGLILTYLLKFKQVCNHPDQFAGSGRFLEEDSGKLMRLREICEDIHARRERVLIFTQFREMVDPLDRFLHSVFGRPGIQLHGGTAVAKRKALVEQFQNENAYIPYFVLSTKAGGVGLNLTAANHVVHFDRWWNPAVEKQAEDRAFRIGQKRNVIVHPFVCKGTVEERIDEMIEKKKELSDNLLASGGEAWITELSDQEIRNLFTLTLTGV